MLAVVETHPVQYHAPVYRCLQQSFGIPVTAIYGSDFSVAGYRDAEFGAEFAWDTDLLSGYSSTFLSRVAAGGARSAAEAPTRGLRRALEALRPDVALVMGYSPRFHRVAWFETRRATGRLLFRGETNDETKPRRPVAATVRRTALRLAYRTCDRILYIGRRSHEHFRRLGVAERRLIFSPYCVDSSAFKTTEADRTRLRLATRTELGLNADDIVFLFSGKLSARKGVDLIVPAVRELPSHLASRIVVALLGDGDGRETVLSQATAAPRVRCVPIGFRNQSQLSPYYHAADALVLPSRHGETWGLVVNEALHHGVPAVVSAAVGCGPDLVQEGQTGHVFDTGSVRSLAAALERTVAMRERPEVRAACRQIVAGYSVDQAAAGIAAGYYAALAGA